MNAHPLSPHFDEIEKCLGYWFKNRSYLGDSFVHKSYYNENEGLVRESNERMEFLGDAVLQLVVAEYLYLHYPHIDEGALTQIRASLVEADSCIGYANHLTLSKFVLLGKGESQNLGRGRGAILADLFEAVMGGIYLDGGYETAKRFFVSHFESVMTEKAERPVMNWKSLLQIHSQKTTGSTAEYVVIGEEGLSHEKVFTVSVSVGGQVIGVGQGRSKREAEQAAANKGCINLGIEHG